MTSYEFEKVAKNAVVKVLNDKYAMTVTLEELQFVWFSHLLGYKKCTLYAPVMNNLYAEVTYNKDKDQLYVDIYSKSSNTVFNSIELNLQAYTEVK